MVAVVWYGGLQVIGLSLTLGELVAFTGYLAFMLMPIFQMGMAWAHQAFPATRGGDLAAAGVEQPGGAQRRLAHQPAATQIPEFQ